jgi:phosphate transport system substrate-binding protein
VAEAFGENFDFPTPVVESGGSSTGLRRFCEGVGENTIDIANASRSIREARSRPAPKRRDRHHRSALRL